VALKGPATRKANKSTITNKLPIRKIGRRFEAFILLFIFPTKYSRHIYFYSGIVLSGCLIELETKSTIKPKSWVGD
jgi:hypothetical protein